MNTNAVTECHTLEIIPLTSLLKFAMIGSRAVILTVGTPDKANEIPGTVKESSSTDDGIIKKKISFERKGVSVAETNRLNGYKSTRVIATYIDENGNRRVAGSPDYPLTFNFTIEGGVYSCVLEGQDAEPDAFLEYYSPS